MAMNFEDMMTFWTMKGLISDHACLTREKIYNSDDTHVTYMMILRTRTDGGGGEHAHVIYRYIDRHGVKLNMAFVYADIVYTGYEDVIPDQVFLKNAKVKDLREHFVERLKHD